MSDSKLRLQRENEELRRAVAFLGAFVDDVEAARIVLRGSDHQRGVKLLEDALAKLPKPQEAPAPEPRTMSTRTRSLLAMLSAVTLHDAPMRYRGR